MNDFGSRKGWVRQAAPATLDRPVEGVKAEPMQRVLVVGSGGAGKSTFARRLGARAGLPVIHLDAFYWRAGWNEMPNDEWVHTVEALLRRDAWVMDGNYGGTLDARLAACDTLVFLDAPRLVCLWRVVRRWLRYRGRSRPDMAAGCEEQMTFEFMWWIWRYPATRRGAILERIRALGPDQRAVVLRTSGDVERFLARVEPAAPAVHSGGIVTPP